MAEWKKRFWQNTGSSYISMALRLGMGVFMFRMMFQGFDGEHLGFWYLLWSLFGYGLLLDFGFGFTAQKAVAEKSATGDLQGLNRLLATIFWTFVMIAIGIMVVFGLLSGPFIHFVLEKKEALSAVAHRDYTLAYLVFFGGIGIMFPLGLFPEILRGRQRIDLANWVNVGTTVINFAGLYTGFKLGWSFPVMMAISVVTSVLPNIVAMFMAFRVLPGLSLKPSFFEWRAVRSQMSFSLAAYIIAFSNLLMSKTDQLVLSMTIGAFAIAIYQAGYKMGEMLETFAVQLQSALSPAAADLGARRDRAGLVELYQRSSRLTLLLITPMYALSAAYLDPLIRLLTGMKEVTSETFWVGQFLLLAIYSSQITNSCSKRILMMSGHEK
ncbi:MAG: rane protein involved in the export of O-antigen and teichoic acid, partial [Akkermansiaceae bacterium]|nr:rane protein involved in the export of O-antigen and teichoic acid [Akkermansiaceae bacterium]